MSARIPLSESYEKNPKTDGTESVLDEILKIPYKSQEIFLWYENVVYTGYVSKPKRSFTISDLVDFLEMESKCNSPIEVIFLTAFVLNYVHTGSPIITLLPQKHIFNGEKHFFADFLYDSEQSLPSECKAKNNFKLIIECDGHDYHKLTKEQVEHDNERDMALETIGYDVIHFSGSQIYNNPWKCAEEALNLILTRTGISKK